MITVKTSLDLPEWAKYITKDIEGNFYAHEFHPCISDSSWVSENGRWGIILGLKNVEQLNGFKVKCRDWRHFIYIYAFENGKPTLFECAFLPKTEKDDKILVSDDGVTWVHQHFAKWATGKYKGCFCYAHGKTSWTAGNDDFLYWPFWKV